MHSIGSSALRDVHLTPCLAAGQRFRLDARCAGDDDDDDDVPAGQKAMRNPATSCSREEDSLGEQCCRPQWCFSVFRVF